MDADKIKDKIRKLEEDIDNAKQCIKDLERGYDVLTDQYMNGDINVDVGKYQRRIKREIERQRRRIEKKSGLIDKLSEALDMEQDDFER